jgi:uridine kinase
MNAVTSLPRRVTRVEELLERVLDLRAATPRGRALLVALSGIDGAGKGVVAARLGDLLRARGLATALVGVDAWLRLPHERFDAYRPGEHFYARALRLEEMFERLVLPLRERRSVEPWRMSPRRPPRPTAVTATRSRTSTSCCSKGSSS